MSELNITELVNAKVVEFGNERFLEGWKGAEKRIIKLIEEHQPEVGSDSGFVYCTCDVYEIWYNEHLIELIKGETNG